MLSRTLESFDEKLFRLNEISHVRVNIDPIFGDVDDEAKAVEIVRSYFPHAEVRVPDRANFCSAVKWLWSDVPDGLVFHLEDDWICHEMINVAMVMDWMRSDVGSVPLLSATHGKKGLKEYSESRTRKRYFGLRLGRRRIIPSFGTSPGFFSGQLLRRISVHLDKKLDPEKQMKPEINPALFDVMEPYRVRFYKSSTDGPMIEDIGREWRQRRSIEKIVTPDGQSIWKSSGKKT